MTGGPLLDVQNLTKQFGGFVALDGISIQVNEGERLGLIGPNGSGKTTLINCVSGVLTNESGVISFQGADITKMPAYRRARLGIARTFQIPKPFKTMTVLENLCIPLEYAARFRTSHGSIEGEAMAILEQMNIAEKARDSSSSLTQIDMRKLELARALAAKPTLLVSDEAMAGLSSNEVDEVLDILFALNERGVAVIMIEHVMRAVMRFSQRVVVLDAGKKIAEAAPDEIVRNPDVERAYLGE